MPELNFAKSDDVYFDYWSPRRNAFSKQYEPQKANINTPCLKAPARTVPVTFPAEKMHKY